MRFALVSKSLQDAARSGIIDPKAVLALAASGLSGILPGEGTILICEGVEPSQEDRQYMIDALKRIVCAPDGSPALKGLGGKDDGVHDYVGLPVAEQVRRLDAVIQAIQTGKGDREYALKPNGMVVSGVRRTMAALVAWIVYGTSRTVDWPVATVEAVEGQTLEDVAFIHNTRHGENTDRVSMVRYIASIMARRPQGVSRREVQELCGLTKSGSTPQSIHNWARVVSRDRLTLADCESLRPYLSKQALASEILDPANGVVGIESILAHCDKGPSVRDMVTADFPKKAHEVGWCQDAIRALLSADGQKNYLAKYRSVAGSDE